jgi:hypothetical protein
MLTIHAVGNQETHLNIIVENMGRLNFGGNLMDTKVELLLLLDVSFSNIYLHTNIGRV